MTTSFDTQPRAGTTRSLATEPRSGPATATGPSTVPVGRGLTGWLMRLCSGPWALSAFGLISFLESAVLLVPIDAVMLPLVLAQPKRFWHIVLAGTLGSVLGAALGYMIGALAYEAVGRVIVDLYGMEADFEQLRATYASAGILLVLVAGITPIPFKLAAIVSGVAGMAFLPFLMAAIAIRFVRFALIGILIRLAGPGIRKLMDRHAGKMMLALAAVMAGGVLAAPLLH